MLSAYVKGRQALQDLENVKDLKIKDKLRNFVVQSIVQFGYENRLKFSRENINSFSEEIIQIFPTEKKDFYFIPAPPSILLENMQLQKFSPKGKLYDSYNNSMKCDIYHPKKKNKSDVANPLDEEASTVEEVPRGQYYLKTWLSQTQANKSMFESRWRDTFGLREMELVPKIEIFLKGWPAFSFSFGCELLDMDCFELLADKNNGLIENYSNIFNTALQKAFEKSKDKINRFNPSKERNTNEFVLDSLYTLSYLCRLGRKLNYEQVIRSMVYIGDNFDYRESKYPIIVINNDFSIIQ
uniref:Uncharacterized protein n=1 Tax=Megaselia scalaris TaxID=36166 RepID=T1GN63_MEGSC